MTSDHVIDNVKKKMLGTAGIIAAVIVMTVFGFNCVYKIPAGYSAVRYDISGGLADKTYGQGWTIVLPTSKLYLYPLSTEIVNMHKAEDGGLGNGVMISTSDGKNCAVSVMYSFHVEETKLPALFNKFRGQNIEQIEQGYLKSELLRCINEVTSQYDLMATVGSAREKINQEVFKRFHDSLEPVGIIVETVSISEAQPDEATIASIQQVIEARNKLERATIEKQTAEQEAERRIIEARGKAEAARLEAEGIAAANELVKNSLSPDLVKQHAVDKWTGEVPKVMGNGNFLFDIPVEER